LLFPPFPSYAGYFKSPQSFANDVLHCPLSKSRSSLVLSGHFNAQACWPIGSILNHSVPHQEPQKSIPSVASALQCPPLGF
jgi:hypothetical protein